MSVCLCFVQKGQISSAQTIDLQQMLRNFSQENFALATDVRWIEVSEGSGYTAGKPSRSSVIILTADRPLQQSRRADLLLQLCSAWAEKAGSDLDHVLAVLADPS